MSKLEKRVERRALKMHERFQEISRNENITIDELEEVFSMGAQV